MNNRLLRVSLCLVVLIGVVNAIADRFYWYSAMWWFDIPMHIAGGVFLGVFAGGLFFSRIRGLSVHDGLVTILLFVLILGLGWELFEYVVQFFIKGHPLANISDSIKDLFMDIVGGSIGACFVFIARRRYNRAHASIDQQRVVG